MEGLLWRGVREAEGARLESVCTLTRIEGSNPSLSASFWFSKNLALFLGLRKCPKTPVFMGFVIF